LRADRARTRPRITSRRRFAAHRTPRLAEARHRDRGFDELSPFVESRRIGALFRLRHSVDGEHTEDHRDIDFEADRHQTAGAFARDVFEMRCVASRMMQTERHDRIVVCPSARDRRQPNGNSYAPARRAPRTIADHRPMRCHVSLAESSVPGDDAFVEPRRDDSDPQVACIGWWRRCRRVEFHDSWST
jgi:hypothetical protein